MPAGRRRPTNSASISITAASSFIHLQLPIPGGQNYPAFRAVPPIVNTTIDTQQLRIYVTLARTLNMSRAAEELRLTPSGVSHCLKTLEADLGCRLFNRSSRKFEISPAGREFLADAERILEQMKTVREKIKTWNDWRQGQLFIGANGTACQFLLPPVLMVLLVIEPLATAVAPEAGMTAVPHCHSTSLLELVHGCRISVQPLILPLAWLP